MLHNILHFLQPIYFVSSVRSCQHIKKMFLNFLRHNCFWLEQAWSSNFCTSCFCPENIWQRSPTHVYSCSNFVDLQMQNLTEKRHIRLISYLPKEIVWWGEEFSSCDTCFLVTWHGCSYGVRKREEELSVGPWREVVLSRKLMNWPGYIVKAFVVRFWRSSPIGITERLAANKFNK